MRCVLQDAQLAGPTDLPGTRPADQCGRAQDGAADREIEDEDCLPDRLRSTEQRPAGDPEDEEQHAAGEDGHVDAARQEVRARVVVSARDRERRCTSTW